MVINICDFSTEVLLHIFQYCDISVLCRLRQCCKRFNLIICTNRIPLHEYNALVTNQIKKSLRNRCRIILEPYEKWRVSHNWKIGRYKTITLLTHRKKFMPWLHLDKQYLWLSREKYVMAYKRTNSPYAFNEHPYYIINDDDTNDIVRFAIKENIIISGKRNGGFWLWSLNEERCLLNTLNGHRSDITCVDLTKDIFITGSHDKSFKIWPLCLETDMTNIRPLYTCNLDDRIWATGISPLKQYVAVGTAGFNNIPPFHVYDVERCQSLLLEDQNFIRGSGILDLHWETDKIVLTCGYDTYLRKWDLRTGKCEQIWEDPYDSTLYCLATDDLYTVFCGTNVYGRVILWDQRYTKYVQMYYMCSGSELNMSSPAYCVSFDSCQLFTALDRCVKCLDFYNHCGQIRNYSDMYLNKIVNTK